MNLRNVLKAFNALRQLADDETALLTTLRNLNDSEWELLVESLSPEKKPAKRGRKASKSPRAASIGAAIQGMAKKPDALTPCTRKSADGSQCGEFEDGPIHDPTMGYGDYHEFQPSAAKAASGG